MFFCECQLFENMDQMTIMTILLKVFYQFNRLLGLFPIHRNKKSKTFTSTWYEILYSVSVWILFSYFYSTDGVDVFLHINRLATIAYFFISLFTISLVYANQCLNAKSIASFLNNTLKIIEEFTQFQDANKNLLVKETVLLFTLKIIIAGVINLTLTVFFCLQMSALITSDVDYILMFLVGAEYFLRAFISNIFYIYILGASFYYDLINYNIGRIIRQANLISQDHKFLKEKLIKLTYRLDKISILHCKLTEHTQQFNRLFSIQILILIGASVISFITEVK